MNSSHEDITRAEKKRIQMDFKEPAPTRLRLRLPSRKRPSIATMPGKRSCLLMWLSYGILDGLLSQTQTPHLPEASVIETFVDQIMEMVVA